jgi:hypothetical protein
VKNAKTKLAAAATVIGLGGLAGVAMSSNSGQGTPAAAKPLKPKVRTQVIRRTVHVTRHAKPSPAATAAGPPAATAVPVAAPGPVSSPAPPVVTQSSGVPATTPSAPVVTSPSGGGGGRGEVENEREGGEHEGRDD